jgi:hypothetical protein
MKIYIAGRISGNANYKAEFEAVACELQAEGHAVLNPAALPEGMFPKDYMRICFAMIDVADKVHFLPGWYASAGARLEMDYCNYIGKLVILPHKKG